MCWGSSTTASGKMDDHIKCHRHIAIFAGNNANTHIYIYAPFLDIQKRLQQVFMMHVMLHIPSVIHKENGSHSFLAVWDPKKPLWVHFATIVHLPPFHIYLSL